MLLMASCACTREDESLPQQGSVSFPETEVTVPSEGGTAGITYTCEDLAPDAELEFESSDSWVHSFSTGGDNTINFTVDANDSGEPRTAIVDVSVKGMAGSSSFAVLQDYVAPPDLQIIIDEIGMNSVKGRTTAADQELRYTVLMLSETNYNSLDRDGQRVFDTFLSDCEIIASYNGISMEEYLEQILVSGEYPFEYTGLNPSTGYVIAAFGLNTESTRTTDVFTKIFTTDDFSNNNIKFTFNIDPIEGYSPDADVIVSASDDTTRYMINYFEKSLVESSGMPLEQLQQMKLDEYITYGQMGGIPAWQVIEANSYYGTDTLNVRDIFKDMTEYVIAACAITDNGKVNSSSSSYEYTTGPLDPSSNQLELTVLEVGVDRVSFSVNATNNDLYHIFLDHAEEYEGMDDNAVLSHITSSFGFMAESRGSQDNLTRGGLTPGESYILAVFGYHNGADKPTTGIDYEIFTLDSEIGDASQLVFNVQVGEVTSNSIAWSVKAEPVSALYYSDVYPAEMTEEEIKADISEDAMFWIDAGYIETFADFFRWVGYRGQEDMLHDGLFSGHDYRIVTVGIFDSNGGYATEMNFSDVITTPDRTVSDATATVGFEKYFDGSELAAIYPELSSAAGQAIVPLTVTTDGDVVNYWYYLYSGNYTDTEAYPDDHIINTLISEGHTTDFTLFSCPYDTEFTICAVAEDSEGNYGPVQRTVLSLTRDGAAPADEFVMPEYSPSLTQHSVSPLRLPDNNQSNN